MALRAGGRPSIPIPCHAFLDQSSMNAMSMPDGSRISRLTPARERLSFAWRSRRFCREKKGLRPSRIQSSAPVAIVVPYERMRRSGIEKRVSAMLLRKIQNLQFTERGHKCSIQQLRNITERRQNLPQQSAGQMSKSWGVDYPLVSQRCRDNRRSGHCENFS